MENITLEQFNYIAEIVASVAVIASLIYVAIQIRQNTATNKLISAQNLSHEVRAGSAIAAANSYLADIHLRGMKDVESLSPSERHQFYLYLNNTYRVYESALYQHTQGVVDEPVFNAITSNMHIGMKTPGYQSFWNERKSIFSKEFQDFYESDSGGHVSVLDSYQEKGSAR
jgi:hypothetical protein